ncbi:hypothetical protein F5148DRAFT_1154949 [Russula earlei]|uniref:Uncharacterized protein n=1 Tax=Russula earlei TaxID=71964 RepID=A0ACC0TRS8_9AGAM|nr:hypothetical protein F5148DRAFT_1154949 [Russula earlei]
MPVTGGYYQWVKRALGTRFAFYEGWWTWLYTFVDLAIYPVLFVEYASFLFPGIEVYKIPVCLCIIWFGAGLNILGIVPVGVFLFKGATAIPAPSLSGIGFSSLGMALYTVMWNFIGWDNATTYAGEVEKPARTYIYSTLIAFGCIVFVYALAVITADVSGMNMNLLNEKGFPALGEWVGGYLRQWQTIACCRPYCKKSIHVIKRLICRDLLVIDIILYGAGLLLEFISLLVLRIKAPNEHRPFKIPLNTTGIGIMVALPMIVWIVALSGALSSSDSIVKAAIFGLCALVIVDTVDTAFTDNGFMGTW